MAKRKRKLNVLRLVLVLLILIALIGALYFGVKFAINVFDNNNNTNETTDTVKVSDSNEEVKIEIVDYSVYIDENSELGFNIILADLKFTSAKTTIYYDLFNLSTAERINLGSLTYYEEKLNELGIDLNSLEYVKEVRDDNTNSVVKKVLIPYSSAKGILKVYNGEVLNFDLTKNNKTIESLKPYNDINETIIDSDDFNITVYDSYIQDFMFKDGQKAQYPSTIDIYTFELQVNKVSKENVSITSATFIPEGTTTVHEALDASYTSNDLDNIINKELKENEKDGLFFAITNTNDSIASFDGKLIIKFSDNTQIEISTNK